MLLPLPYWSTLIIGTAVELSYLQWNTFSILIFGVQKWCAHLAMVLHAARHLSL